MQKTNCQFDGNCQKLKKQTSRKTGITVYTCEGNRQFELSQKLSSLLKLPQPIQKRTLSRIENIKKKLENQPEKQYCQRVNLYMGNTAKLNSVFGKY